VAGAIDIICPNYRKGGLEGAAGPSTTSSVEVKISKAIRLVKHKATCHGQEILYFSKVFKLYVNLQGNIE
jgi:hypothetical protein